MTYVASRAVWHFRGLPTQRKNWKELVISFKKQWGIREAFLGGKSWLFWKIRMGFWQRTSVRLFLECKLLFVLIHLLKGMLDHQSFLENELGLPYMPLSRLVCWWKQRAFVQILCQCLNFSFEMIKRTGAVWLLHVCFSMTFSLVFLPKNFTL